VDTLEQKEMHHLKTTTQYEIIIVSLKPYRKYFIIIQFLSTCSLKLHFQDVLNHLDLFASHILCLNLKKKQNIQRHQEMYNVILNNSKFFHVMTSMAQ
jgi:hypothetical protein